MKKLLGGLIAILFVLASCKGTNKDQIKPVADESKKSGQANILSMTVKKDAETRSFKISEKDKTLILTLPADTTFNLASLAPTIKVSEKATVSPASEVPQDFSAGKTVLYTVQAENGTKKEYTASVKKLDARGNLTVDAIYVWGKKVEANKVTIPKENTIVEAKDVAITFKGEETPTTWKMNPTKITLNKIGEKKTITLSTEQTDRWNAWNTTTPIEVTRGGEENNTTPSSEAKMLSFELNGSKVDIPDGTVIVECVTPYGTNLKSAVPIVVCSEGASVMPAPGAPVDFSNSSAVPVQYTVTSQDKLHQTVYSVKVTQAARNEAKILEFKFATAPNKFVKAKILEKMLKIEAEVASNVDISNITPEVKVSPGASYSPTTVQNFTNSEKEPIEYTVTAADGVTKQVYKVHIIRKLSKIAKIKSFSIDYVYAELDHNAHTIKLQLDPTTNLTSLTPVIEVEERGKVTTAKEDPQDFSDSKNNPIEYTVTSEDGSTTAVYKATVTNREKSKEAKILSFAVTPRNGGNFPGKIDEATHKILCEVPDTLNLAEITPTIETSAYASVNPRSRQAQDFTNSVASPVKYTVKAEAGNTQVYDVTVRYIRSNDAEIKTFVVGSTAGTVDHDKKTVLVKLPKGDSLNPITPTVTVHAKASYTPTEAQDFTNSEKNPIKYTVTAEDGTKRDYMVTVTHIKSNQAEITSFKIGAVNGEIDQSKKTILVKLEKGASLNPLTPTIVASAGATVSPKDPQDFTNSVTSPIKYTVTAEDGTTKKEYSVVVRNKFSGNDITKFTVANVQGEIDNGANKILVKLPKTEGLTSITPTIETSKGATVSPTTVQDFSGSVANPITYTVTAEDGTAKTYAVTIRHIGTEAKIIEFKVQNQIKNEIKEDVTPSTIYVEVPYIPNLKKVKPAIKISEYAKVLPASDAEQDFSTGAVTYTVTSEDGKTTRTYVATVKKMPPDSKIKIWGVAVDKDGEGNMTVKIPSDKTSIAVENVEITYEENGITHTVPKEKIKLGGDFSGLSGSAHKMILQVKISLGGEYADNATMSIEVSNN